MATYANKTIKQKTFEDLRQEVLINMIVATQRVRKVFEQVCEQENITLPQFNILRILKGVHPGAHPRSEISKRMIDNSDVTRLTDKLEQAGLVKRITAETDKRQSMSMITAKGIKVLERLAPHFETTHKQLTHNLNNNELETIAALLKKIGQ